MFSHERVFSFISMAYPGDTFAVVSMDAQEGINELYRVELLLASKEHSVDFNDLLDSPAHMLLHGRGREFTVHGVLAEIEQLHQVGEFCFYRVLLMPKLWLLTLLNHNQVFLDKTVPQVLEAVLQEGGLTSHDYEFRLQQDYPARELICQYNETHYHFFLRWLEREGLYYYFERLDDRTRLIVTDTRISHKDLVRHKEVRYTPPSGLQPGQDDEVIHSFVCRRQLTARNVQLKDYNDQTPNLEIQAMHQVADTGRGVTYHYGDHILTPSEGRRLAQIQAEGHRVKALRYQGTSNLGALRSGFVFSLRGHFRPDFNQDYVVTGCHHRGNQAAFLVSGLREALHGLVEEGPLYTNSFEAIPADLQYRPKRTLQKPRITGTLPAKIDASGSGKYAELDEQGRYTVILPFDLSGRKNGKASCRLRLLQPYAGSGHGMHFPLHKGAEVLLTFIDGDPDRPVIAGAVPNAEAYSPVTAANQTMSKIATAGGNILHFEDKDDAKRILLQSPTANTWLRLGAPNDPPATTEDEDPTESHWETEKNTDGFRIVTTGDWYGAIGQNMEIKVGGNSTEIIVGGEETVVGGFYNHTVVGIKTEITVAALFEFLYGAVLEIALAAKLGVAVGFNYEVDLALHGEFRPKAFDAAEHFLKFHNKSTELHDLKTELGEAKEKIQEQDRAIVMAHEAIIEDRNEIAATRNSIAENDTRLRTKLTEVLQDRFNMIENAVLFLTETLEIGDERVLTFTEEIHSSPMVTFL